MAHDTELDSEIFYARFGPRAFGYRNEAQLAQTFSAVFAGAPWNEWMKCQACGQQWGRGEKAELERLGNAHCGTPVVPFWPEEVVVADLRREITRDASAWVAMEGSSIIGFTWGYSIALVELEEKLELYFRERARRAGASEVIAYQDELGVLEPYRKQKIARKLFALRLRDLLDQGLTYGIVRTRAEPEPSVTYLWFTQKLGYQELARYPGSDGRVVLGASLQRVEALLLRNR